MQHFRGSGEGGVDYSSKLFLRSWGGGGVEGNLGSGEGPVSTKISSPEGRIKVTAFRAKMLSTGFQKERGEIQKQRGETTIFDAACCISGD